MAELWVPTAELVGVLGDVLPFAGQQPEVPELYAVRVEWDGDMLHAYATDRYRLAWCRWHPHDLPEAGLMDDLFTDWGTSGDDQPWSVLVWPEDAEHLRKVFKLPRKQGRVPLSITVSETGMTVSRHGETGHPAQTVVLEHRDVAFPSIAEAFERVSELAAVEALAFSTWYLADLGKIRARGPMEMTFTGPGKVVVLLRMGDRWSGMVASQQIPTERATDG